MTCRLCHAELSRVVIDLGSAPPSNAYLAADDLGQPERRFPLRVLLCEGCWLAQTEDYVGAGELFSADYAYFSSVASSGLAHARRFVADATERFGLHAESRVVEVAANDGYLLQYVKERGIPCYGIEPTASTAAAARARGIEIVEAFFGAALGASLAAAGRGADLLVANNVLAHVPDLNDFLTGVTRLLEPTGVASFEFPSLVRLLEDGRFDTIYHEHFSYFSLSTAVRACESNGLRPFDAAELPTHGGSLRLFAERQARAGRPASARLNELLAREDTTGVRTTAYYGGLQARAERSRDGFREYLQTARSQNLRVAAYGAAAKANTLLNYAGVGPDLIAFVADRSSAKQGRFLPGSHIPIVAEDQLRSERPDRVFLLPWNLEAELTAQLAYVNSWGGRLVVALPELRELGQPAVPPAGE